MSIIFLLQSLFSGSQLCSNQSRVHSTMHLPVVVDKKQDNAKTIISIFRNGREKIIMRNRLWNLHVVEWIFFSSELWVSHPNFIYSTIPSSFLSISSIIQILRQVWHVEYWPFSCGDGYKRQAAKEEHDKVTNNWTDVFTFHQVCLWKLIWQAGGHQNQNNTKP